jgi:hypothetical protein
VTGPTFLAHLCLSAIAPPTPPSPVLALVLPDTILSLMLMMLLKEGADPLKLSPSSFMPLSRQQPQLSRQPQPMSQQPPMEGARSKLPIIMPQKK